MEALKLYDLNINNLRSYQFVDITLPKSRMQVYALDNGYEIKGYTTTEVRLPDEANDTRNATVDYVGTFAGKRDVISIVYDDDKEFHVVSIIDDESYYSLDLGKWNKGQRSIWNKKHGNLRSLYNSIEKKNYIRTLTKIK